MYQLLGKSKAPLKAPLINLPIVGEPFNTIIVDICGPLTVCSESGNRFIFTVVDMCTRYPIAIPLVRHTAENIANAIVDVFSTFGHSNNLISDKGCDLTSHLWREFINILKVHQTYSTIGNP